MASYLENRLKFHTASRVAIETQQPLAAAMNVDGHVVTDKKVWTSKTSEFPLNSSSWKNSTDVIGTTNDLVSVFTNNRTEGSGITRTALNNGYVWKNSAYPAVELYDAVEMSAVQFSDGPDSQGKPQAYEIIGSNGLRVTDWVPPTAVIDPETGSPVPGYTGIGEAFDGTDWTILQQSAKANYAWALANGYWEFVYISGMLTFDPGFTPTAPGMGYTKVRYTGFKYIGSTLDTAITAVQAGSMAVKPFGFDISKMSDTGDGQKHINIPGLVISVVNDNVGFSLADFQYLADGSTDVTFIDVDAAQLGENTAFTAYTLTKTDGSKITMLEKTNL